MHNYKNRKKLNYIHHHISLYLLYYYLIKIMAEKKNGIIQKYNDYKFKHEYFCFNRKKEGIHKIYYDNG